MSFLLTPLAVQHRELLEAIANIAPDATIDGLAATLGRDPSNFRKTLKLLEAEGLLVRTGQEGSPPIELAGPGSAAVRAMRRLEGDGGELPAPTSAGLFRPVRHAEVIPDPWNPRKVFDDEALAELQASIVRDGLLEPIVIRTIPAEAEVPAGVRFMLIAGERRWRAIGLAIEAGDWPADRAIPAMLREVADEQEARRLALVENLQRRDLNAVEEARALKLLVELTGGSAAQVGRDLGFSERWAQQRLAILELSPALQNHVEAGKITLEQTRGLQALVAKLPPIKVTELERGALTVGDAKAWLAAQPEPLSDAAKLALCEFMAKHEREPFDADNYSSQPTLEVVAETLRKEVEGSHTSIRVKVADPAFDELVKRNIFDNARAYTIEGVETGRHYASRRWYSDGAVKEACPEALTVKARDRLIGELRVKLHGLQADFDLAQSGRQATAWLNPTPCELPADVQAEIERKRAARQKASAEREAAEKERLAVIAAERQRHAERLKAVADMEAVLAAGQAFPANLAAMAAGVDRPLPWFLETGSNHILAANGRQVTTSSYHYVGPEQLVALRLVVALANSAAGFVMPLTKPAEIDPEADRAEFLELIVKELATFEGGDDPLEPMPDLVVNQPKVAAERGLDEFLRRQEIVFGDAEYDWGEEGAMAVAHGIVVDGLGLQIDLEEAIAATADDAGDDVEITPALARLAGGAAQDAGAGA